LSEPFVRHADVHQVKRLDGGGCRPYGRASTIPAMRR
jgi:hypothetical protein